MKRLAFCFATAACLGAVADGSAQARQPTLVLNGGNRMGLEITRPVRDMAGGDHAVVAVVIHEQGPGEEALEDWRRAQLAEVIPIAVGDVASSRPAFDRATVIWFAGGFTTRLMDAIRDTYLPRYVHERWADGGVVGGDSAGAMIFPEDMLISGPADLTSIVAGRTKTTTGLGLAPRLLFDAHFLKRQRLNRLISLVLDHPDRVGIGADEGTAVVIRGTQLQVLGMSNVVVLDGRKGRIPRLPGGQVSSGRDLRMQVLTHGMTLDLGNAAPKP